MPKHFFPLLFAAFFMMSAMPAFAEDNANIVGTIMAVEGEVVVKHDGERKLASIKTPIELRDTVETDKGAKAAILMIDDTQVTLGEKAKFIARDYVFDDTKKEGNKASYSIFGAFSYVSGLLSKTPEPDVHINTHYGNIGIRGTTVYGGPLGNLFGIYLQHGKIDVNNGGGGVEMDAGQGTDISQGGKPGDPAPWPKDKIKKLKGLVKLKDEAGLKNRIAGFKGKQKQLREQHKKNLKHGKKFSLRLRYLPLDTQPPTAPFIPCIGGRRAGGC